MVDVVPELRLDAHATCGLPFTSLSQGSASSPLPSKPPGLVRGFQIPARKLWQPFCANWRAVVITCSSVSAEHGPAITNGRSLSLGRFNGCSSNSIVVYFLCFSYSFSCLLYLVFFGTERYADIARA